MIPIWVFLQDGFFSVVQHRTKPSHVFVRARRREDLERMCKKLDYCNIEIEERPGNDYRWAAVVVRDEWRMYVGDCIDAIDYTTGVKDHLDQGEDDRHAAMYRVWSAMMTLQEGGKYNPPFHPSPVCVCGDRQRRHALPDGLGQCEDCDCLRFHLSPATLPNRDYPPYFDDDDDDDITALTDAAARKLTP